MPTSTPGPTPAPATTTRELLYAAGLRRFARDGWRTARVRDIVADAGQGNDSAINYHFGSRDGLLAEVLRRGVASMEPRRVEDLAGLGPESPPGAVAEAVIRPLAEMLATEQGRSFLRIAGQLGPLAQVTDTLVTEPTAGTALQGQMRLLVATVGDRIGTAMARRRISAMIVMLTAALAARAAEVDRAAATDEPDGDDLEDFIRDLVLTVSTGLLAPPTDDPASDRRRPGPPVTPVTR